jgi:hypothetical protein
LVIEASSAAAWPFVAGRPARVWVSTSWAVSFWPFSAWSWTGSFAALERRVGVRKLLLEGLPGGLLVGQRLPHRLDQVVVPGDGALAEISLTGRLGGPHRLRLLPPRQRDEVQEKEVDDEEQERLVHDAAGREA